jgi:hypothetical protein
MTEMTRKPVLGSLLMGQGVAAVAWCADAAVDASYERSVTFRTLAGTGTIRCMRSRADQQLAAGDCLSGLGNASAGWESAQGPGMRSEAREISWLGQ